MSSEPTFCPGCYHAYPRDRVTGRVLSTSCKRRTCPIYAPKYLRRLAEVVRCALAEWKGQTTIATLTAPGTDRLPWDESLCKIKGPHSHSGPNGCQVQPWRAAEYNRKVTKQLSAMANRAAQDVRRMGLPVPTTLARVLELKRGVFHAHIVLGWLSWAERAGLDAYLDRLDVLRGEFGFGTAAGGFDRGAPGRFDAAGAGAYTSKYLRPDGAKGSFIPALLRLESVTPTNRDTGRKVSQLRPVYVNSKLTRLSGVTMRFLRWAAYAFVKWGRVEVPRAELLRVFELVKVFGQVDLLELAPPMPPPVSDAA